jgi:hypothetical protein
MENDNTCATISSTAQGHFLKNHFPLSLFVVIFVKFLHPVLICITESVRGLYGLIM